MGYCQWYKMVVVEIIMHTYIACFDIADDRVRYRVAKLLGHFGNRVQRSVYELGFKRTGQLQTLVADVAALLEHGDDCRFYCLCKTCRGKCIDCDGKPVARFPASVVV